MVLRQLLANSTAVSFGSRLNSSCLSEWRRLRGALFRKNPKSRFPLLAFVARNHQLFATRKPIPKLRPGWALIRVHLAGICNTDVEILRGYHNFRGTPGHEFVGEVQNVAGVRSRE